jgi:hypothetical protein
MRTGQAAQKAAPKLRVGELVEVRSEKEIRSTLDERGELEALPFMPEMLEFCGRRFRVDKLAIKLCDPSSGMYRMDHAVHLAGVRCSGQAHGGCQAGCLIYWKEAWLKPVAACDQEVEADEAWPADASSGRTHLDLIALTRKDNGLAPGTEVYSCQATELVRASSGYIPSWDIRQYVRDVRSGNAGMLVATRSVCVGAFNRYQVLSRRFLPRRLRIRGGRRYPFIEGKLRKTPEVALGLQPGELVRIKSVEEIVKTLDTTNRNRGMTFDTEMLKYCGRQARVLRRVERIIDENTGKMQSLRNACIVLQDVICTSDYHRLCPRGIYPYWREIWLERVADPDSVE